MWGLRPIKFLLSSIQSSQGKVHVSFADSDFFRPWAVRYPGEYGLCCRQIKLATHYLAFEVATLHFQQALAGVNMMPALTSTCEIVPVTGAPSVSVSPPPSIRPRTAKMFSDCPRCTKSQWRKCRQSSTSLSAQALAAFTFSVATLRVVARPGVSHDLALPPHSRGGTALTLSRIVLLPDIDRAPLQGPFASRPVFALIEGPLLSPIQGCCRFPSRQSNLAWCLYRNLER